MPRIILKPRPQTAQYFTEDLDGVGLDMVRIPAGTFVMGSPETEESSGDAERPQHVVNVPEFCLGRYPVTQAQWRVVAGWKQIDKELETEPSSFKGDDLPVEQVSWLDAKEFSGRLNRRLGKTYQYRLPSEAEWEYACRAERFKLSLVAEQLSLKDRERLIQEWNEKYLKPFSFGETLTAELANYYADSTYGRGVEGEYRGKTTSVGSFPANSFGLCDMHGNLYEWCEDDWHENYDNAPTDGSVWLNDDNDTSKILRGGAWNINPRFCRSAYRLNDNRDVRNNNIGFRVACSLPGFP